MKPSLQLKIVIVLGYVALCTMLVVGVQQGEAAPGGQPPVVSGYE